MEESSGEVIKELEASLAKDLQDLKNEIEENDLVHGLPHKGISSIPIPKDAEYFRLERRLAVQRLLQVADVKPLPILADVMREEKDICCSPEYSHESILLLLHDHFIKRMHELANCRYEHLLRWRRFREHLGVLENLQPYFSSRMELLLKHYEDYSSRAQRLASVCESFFYKSDNAVEDMNPDDIVLYLRWLVSHLQSIRLYSQFLKVIQWTPYAHRHDVSKELPEYLTQPNPDGPLEEDGAAAHPAASSVVRVVQAAPADHALHEVPTPPPMIAPNVTAHNPVSQNQFTLALAAAATQTVWNSSLLSLPLHTNEVDDLKPHLLAYCEIYAIGANAETLQSASDEMELFACVNRKFRQIFFQQEVQRTFRTYDHREFQQEDGVSIDKKIAKYKPKTDVEKWGLDTPSHALRKPANWLKFAKLQPERSVATEQTMTELRRRKQVDELLRSACRFAGVSDPERVQDVLRSHASAVANPPHLHGTAVATYASGKKTIDTWRKIYSNPQIYDESVSFQSTGEARKKKRRESFDFNQTMQSLGLNDADSMKDDPAGVQGAYLSYLHLRHLKTRDLKRTCLSYLNYFRSVERTVTINDQGVFEEGGSEERSPVDHRVGNEAEGYQGGSNPLGCHDYMYSTPKDHKYNETDFMRFQDVENFDDFYTHEEGRVHVRDHRGYYVVYDQAMDDLKGLEEDMLLVASHYIQKDRDAMEKLAARRASKSTAGGGGGGEDDSGDFAIGKYGHAAVDRFAVVLDIWNQEAQFMQSKKALIDLYMEAYHNTFDRDEKRSLAQAMVSLIHRRPRYDFSAAYFLTTYRLECTSMRLQASLVQKFMERQISQQRDYVNRLNRDSGSQGLPLDFVAKQLVSVHTDQAASKSQYLLEFHPSLCVVSRLPRAFQHALTELVNLHQAKTSNEEIQLERSMFEVLHREWDSLDSLGASYTQQTKNNLFSGIFMDDPQAVANVAKSAMAESDKANARADKKVRKKRLLESAGQVLELVTQRHRLCDLAWESEILAKVYKAISVDTGFGEYHAFIRYIQLESARRVEGAETAKPPTSIVQVLEDDSAVDKFQPSNYLLAIQEIDEGHLGRFSFRSKDSVQALLAGSGVLNLQVVLKLQTVHRNALSSAVLLAHTCRFDPSDVGKSGQGGALKRNASLKLQSSSSDAKDVKNQTPLLLQAGRMSPSDTRSERSTLTAFSFGGGTSTAAAAAAAAATSTSFRAFEKQRNGGRFDPESFFSVQLEKTPGRNRMINTFAAKKDSSAMLLKSQSELEKLKRELISQLSDDFDQRVRQASMRAQLIGYYNSIRDSLAQMPAIAAAYFMLGEKNEPKPEEDPESVTADPRTLKKRPRQLLSDSGDLLLNLWFIPHYTDLLTMFRGLDDKRATKALENAVRIVGSFHDILQYLIGYSQLGTSGSRSGAAKSEEPTAADTDWSGSQGLGSELREIQKQLDNLPNPRSADQAAELLSLKRNVLFLEFDVCIRHVLPETFLASGNMAGYKSVTENMRQPLTQLSNAQVACLDSVALDVPSPLEARDATAQQLFPWRSFASRRGPYSSMQWQWWTVGSNMQLCLAGLREVDKPTVHGELLSMSLCLEDVAKAGEIPESYAGKPVGIEDRENFLLIGKRMLERVRKRPEDEAASSASSTQLMLLQQQQQQQASGHSPMVEQAREACRLQIRFLTLWKRVDALKYFWARHRMNVAKIDTVARYQQFCKLYKAEKLYPIMRSLALQFGQEELCEPGPLQADTDVFVTPQGVPEMTVRQRQLVKLLEFVESHMINEVRKRLHRETDLVIKERNREEDNLPTDLWKRSCMKESFSLKRPPFLEEFLTALDKEAVETDDGKVVFSADGLNRCLNHLCILSTQNQRETYESYASYYESILRQQHQVLYDRERQVEHLQNLIREKEETVAIEAQLQMAETVYSLLMEVTALRAKVSEMREQTIRQKTEIRDSVRCEYNDLVQSLFACNFEQKMRLDEYRKHMLSATMARISDVRTEASEAMSKIRERTATSRLVTEKELSERNDRLSEALAQLEQENVRLGQLMNRQKALFNWKQTYARCEFQKKLSELDQEKEQQRKRATVVDLLSTEKSQQLTHELGQAKECLVRTERELGETRRKLDRLQRDDQDRRHADERRDRSDRQLADAKQLHIDKLMDEISETRRNFQSAKDDLNRSFRTQQSIADKTTKQVEVLRQQLKEEKRLKEDAFGKVDNLLSQLTESRSPSVRFASASPDVQVYELESVAALSRAQTSIGFSQPLATDSRARPGSTRPNSTLGGAGRRSASVTAAVSRPVSGVGGSAGYAPLPRWTQKSLTPDLRLPPRPPTASAAGLGLGGAGGQSNGQARPKTVGASGQRLRAKLAEQLLYNIEPDHHTTLMQLKDASTTSVN